VLRCSTNHLPGPVAGCKHSRATDLKICFSNHTALKIKKQPPRENSKHLPGFSGDKARNSPDTAASRIDKHSSRGFIEPLGVDLRWKVQYGSLF